MRKRTHGTIWEIRQRNAEQLYKQILAADIDAAESFIARSKDLARKRLAVALASKRKKPWTKQRRTKPKITAPV
jgi:hypothetical protein